MLLNFGAREDSSESFGLKGDQIFFGRSEAAAEAPILWLPGVKSQVIGKDPDAGKN